ncbi:MAG: DoxX-like family protein [Mariniblastus sp.]
MVSSINSFNLSRFAVAFIWLYHGLIPKLLFSHPTELELVVKGPTLGTPEMTVFVAGVLEVAIGLTVIVFWRAKWPIYLSLVGFAMLLIGAFALSPEHATHAFNPVSLTVSAIIFCLIQLVESYDDKEIGRSERSSSTS